MDFFLPLCGARILMLSDIYFSILHRSQIIYLLCVEQMDFYGFLWTTTLCSTIMDFYFVLKVRTFLWTSILFQTCLDLYGFIFFAKHTWISKDFLYLCVKRGLLMQAYMLIYFALIMDFLCRAWIYCILSRARTSCLEHRFFIPRIVGCATELSRIDHQTRLDWLLDFSRLTT